MGRPVTRAIDALANRGRFAPTLRVMQALNEHGDQGDSSESDALLGPNTTTLEDMFGSSAAGHELAPARR